jgi:low affinity Fe/Cu permease
MADREASRLSLADRFSRAALWTSEQCGRAHTFIIAVALILVWAVSGPVFHYSDTWQLIINTGTTIITFLMVFLIQHAQNRDTAAIQLKLDELIRANENARNELLKLEDLTESQLQRLKDDLASAMSAEVILRPLEVVRPELAMVSKELKQSTGTAPRRQHQQ